MKKSTNILAPLLVKYRYKSKPDPFSIFMNLRQNEIMPTASKGNILLLPIRVNPVSNLFEGIYGYAMKLRGYSVHALFCNQVIEKCENIQNMASSSIRCSLCNYEQKRFANTFALESNNIDNIVDKNDIERIEKIIKTTTTNNLLNLKYDNVLLGHHIRSAVMRYLFISRVDIIKHEKLIRQFAYSTIMSYESTKQLLHKLEPKFVLSSHGVYSTWGGALEACKKLSIPVIVWGRGYIGGDIIISRNESYLYERVYESTKNWEDIQLSYNQKEKLRNYFLAKKNPHSSVDHVNYYNGIHESNKSLIEVLNLDTSRIKFGLFPNIPWDGTTFSASKAFPTIESFLETTINWFQKNSQFDLIIRAHPAELKNPHLETIKDVIDSMYNDLPNNVYFLEANHIVTSYEVEKHCDTCLMYASTMSLEFAYSGKTVIQTGQSNVSNKGFIFEAKSVENYQELLDKASNNELQMTNDMKERVERYAYHWIYKRHIPETIYNHKALTFTEYNIKSSMDLAPGKNKVVDWFIDRCEDGKPFIWEDDA